MEINLGYFTSEKEHVISRVCGSKLFFFLHCTDLYSGGISPVDIPVKSLMHCFKLWNYFVIYHSGNSWGGEEWFWDSFQIKMLVIGSSYSPPEYRKDIWIYVFHWESTTCISHKLKSKRAADDEVPLTADSLENWSPHQTERTYFHI